MNKEQRAFQEFELSGWETVADEFSKGIGVSTAQIIPILLREVGAKSGERLLDVATGPGHLPGAASKRGIEAIGIDFAQAMIDIASNLYPTITFRKGAAEELPFGDEEFDAVVSAFGMPHFADHVAHLREAYRVLRPEGRIAFATWYGADRSAYFDVLDQAFAIAGRSSVTLPSGPDMYLWSDVGKCRTVLIDQIGFCDFRAVDVEVQFPLHDGAATFLAYVESGVRGRAAYRAYAEIERLRIAEKIDQLLTPYLDGNNPAIPALALVVSATRP